MTNKNSMKANVFRSVDRFGLEEVERPHAGPGDAVVRVTTTTICGTDLHIVRGEYPVKSWARDWTRNGRYRRRARSEVFPETSVGDRVLVGAITPCGQCGACLSGHLSQCGHGGGYEAIGGWRLGNTLNGAQAEYVGIPAAQASLAKIPDELSDEQVILLSDIGFDRLQRRGDPVAYASATRWSSSPKDRSAFARASAPNSWGLHW